MDKNEISSNELYLVLWEGVAHEGIQATCGQILDLSKYVAAKLGITSFDDQLHKISVLQRALSLATLGPTWDGSTDYLSYIEQAEKEITAEGH